MLKFCLNNLNSIGLAIDMIGVSLVYFFGVVSHDAKFKSLTHQDTKKMRNDEFSLYVDSLSEQKPTTQDLRSFIKKKHLFNYFHITGYFLIMIGFALQITSNWWQL